MFAKLLLGRPCQRVLCCVVLCVNNWFRERHRKGNRRAERKEKIPHGRRRVLTARPRMKQFSGHTSNIFRRGLACSFQSFIHPLRSMFVCGILYFKVPHTVPEYRRYLLHILLVYSQREIHNRVRCVQFAYSEDTHVQEILFACCCQVTIFRSLSTIIQRHSSEAQTGACPLRKRESSGLERFR